MNEDSLRGLVLEKLSAIAPDIIVDDMDPDRSFRDQYEFDSIDFLNLMMALEKALGMQIPALQYPRLSSLNGAVSWLLEQLRETG